MSDINKKKLFIPRKIEGEGSRWEMLNKEQPIKNINGKKIQINQYTHDGNKTGYWEDYHYNGRLESKGIYVNGLREGYWENYHYNGEIDSKGNYINGKKEGYWEKYDDGKIESKGSYINDLRDGYWEDYFSNGKLCRKGEYVNDKKEGIWDFFYDNGKLMRKRLYKNGSLVEIIPLTESKKLFIPRKLSGEGSRWEQWNKEQPIIDSKRINQYDDNGLKQGYWEDYYTNGKVWRKGEYVNDKKEGIWEFYYYGSGELRSKVIYKNGRLIEKLPLTESKKLFVPRRLSGEDNRHIKWNKEQPIETIGGEKIRINQYDSEGRKQGYWYYYNSDGKLLAKELFKNGKYVKFMDLPITETETPSFLLKEEMVLIREGNIQDYINNVLTKIKNLPYETKKKYLTIAISTLLGYTSYPVIQSMFDKSPDKEAKEIVHRVMNKKDNFSMFKDGTKFRLSEKGFQHIMNEEKPKLIAYALGDGKITVGYGHAEPVETTNLKVGQKITKEQAKLYLKQDLKIAADGVRRMFNDWKKQNKNYKVTQDMFDALVSMAFNMGVSGLRNTSLVDHLRDGDYKTAGQLIKYTKINPDTFPGLEKRRNRESDMFLSYLSKPNKINV